MNERIQAIATRAGLFMDVNGRPYPVQLSAEESADVYAKFAKLILEEANDIVYDLLDDNTGAEVVVRVKEHFGIE